MTHPVVDTSREFINNEFFLGNISILQKNNTQLAKDISSLVPGEPDEYFPDLRFEISTSRNGQLNIFAIDGETEIPLHSTYDPAREASDQVRGVLKDEKRNYFVVLGFGLGYAVEELLREIDPNSIVLVVEPHLASFRLALAVRDISGIIGDPRVLLAFGTGVDNALAAFMRRYHLADCRGVGFMEIASRNKLPSSQFHTTFLERLKGLLVTSGGNLQTLMTMAWQYQKNTMMSLGKIVTSPPVRVLFDSFKDKPAIIVSAGPSLEKNIDQIAALKDRAAVIAVDTSLRILLNHGIEPHLVCTGDPQEANWRHLKGTVTTHAHLIAEPMTHFASLEHFKGRLFIASYGDKVMKWISNFIPDVGIVMCWGSVATMAFDVARKLGCSPIIFTGQDLSFPGGRTYAHGTYFEEEEKQDMSVEAFEQKHRTYTMTDIYGNTVKTNRQMFAYKEWFRTEFARTESKVINATEGGILKENCEIMTLAEASERYLNERFDAAAIIENASSGFSSYDTEPLKIALSEMTGSIRRCVDICDNGVKRIKEAVVAVEQMDKLPPMWCMQVIKDLDEFRFRLKEENAMGPFLETANQTGILNFHRAYKAVNNSNFSRVTFKKALDLYTDLFISTGRTARGVLQFFVNGYRILAEADGAGMNNSEELCLKNSDSR
ncbi:MAG TPA: DUF115 domain-containing protein [Firmicutes bacterium]|mgnify:CR=1 FL=1|nr:DUF115 domain-containing protein [Bacillota bacterium]